MRRQLAWSDKSRTANLLMMIVIGMAALSLLLYGGFVVISLSGRGVPLEILFPHSPAFWDAWDYRVRFHYFHTEAFFQAMPTVSSFAYPPLSAFVYRALYLGFRPDNEIAVITSAFCVAIFVAACFRLKSWLANKASLAIAATLLALFSYPAIFLTERGNIETIVCTLVLLGLVSYRRDSPYLAAVLFGLAASMKLYPILLLGLFFSHRRDVKPLLAGIFTALGSTALAIWLTGPTFSVAGLGYLGGVLQFQNAYVETVKTLELVYDHSLFSIWKRLAEDRGVSPAPWLHTYYVVAGLFTTVLFFTRVRRLSFWNRAAFLLISMVLLPPVSYPYTFVHLYLPVLEIFGVLWLQSLAGTPFKRSHLACLACGLFLMLPLNAANLLTHHYLPAGQVQAVVLFLFLILISLDPLPEVPASVEMHPSSQSPFHVAVP